MWLGLIFYRNSKGLTNWLYIQNNRNNMIVICFHPLFNKVLISFPTKFPNRKRIWIYMSGGLPILWKREDNGNRHYNWFCIVECLVPSSIAGANVNFIVSAAFQFHKNITITGSHERHIPWILHLLCVSAGPSALKNF